MSLNQPATVSIAPLIPSLMSSPACSANFPNPPNHPPTVDVMFSHRPPNVDVMLSHASDTPSSMALLRLAILPLTVLANPKTLSLASFSVFFRSILDTAFTILSMMPLILTMALFTGSRIALIFVFIFSANFAPFIIDSLILLYCSALRLTSSTLPNGVSSVDAEEESDDFA